EGMNKNFRKLDKFEGHDFRRWQKNIHFLLTTLKVIHVLKTPMSELIEDDTNVESAKKLWDSLEFEYMAEDASTFYVHVDIITWWIDSGATTHVCKDRCWFNTYEPVEDGSVLYMGDDHFTPVHGKGSVVLEFSLGKSITLFNVLYVPKLRNKKYVITFIDDASRFCYIYLLHAKDEALDRFRIYKTEVELQHNDLNKTLRTDRGGEYYDPVFFQSVGIIHETIAPYTPQQNGVAERKNKALKEMVNSMLSYSGLSERFWGEAMLTACYLLNKGCRAVVRLPDLKGKLWVKRALIASLLDMLSIPRHIDQRILYHSVESQRDDHSDDEPNETSGPRKGKIVRKAKSYGSDFLLYLVEGSRDQVRSQYSYCYSIEEDPRTYNEAMQSRDATLWKKAIDDEIDKFKARLVIQSFKQKEGIDYFDTYAPVARITTIRLLLALVAIHNLVTHQMDVKKTLLNGDLEEEVYMKQPKGFVMLGEVDVILGIKIKCKNKEIVITQSHYIEEILKKFECEDYSMVSTPMDLLEKLKPNTGKPVDQLKYSRAIDCLMYAMTSTRPDIAYAVGRLSRFTSNPSKQHWHAITRVFKYLKGTMNYGLSYVGYPSVLEAYSDASWINHVEDLSSTSGWVFLLGRDYSMVSTPMDLVEKLKPNTGKPVDQLKYSRAIDCLMYAMTSTRPDIAYAVGRLSRFTSNPSKQHWHAITRVFKYLKGTMNYGLSYVGYPSVLEAYSDASWINHVEDLSSTSGWVFLLGRALAAAGKEAEWLRNLIHEILIWPKPIAPISVRCDSAATLAKAYSQIYNGKSRHLGVRHSMIRELIRNGVISIKFVQLQNNLADHLTEGLARDLVIKSVTGIGLKSI
nr:hypothetical protein [Tanacetum cinerariifolium]